MNFTYQGLDISCNVIKSDNGFRDGTLYEVEYYSILDDEGNVVNPRDIPDNLLEAMQEYAVDSFKYPF